MKYQATIDFEVEDEVNILDLIGHRNRAVCLARRRTVRARYPGDARLHQAPGRRHTGRGLTAAASDNAGTPDAQAV
jgi:hypothetical protein